MLYEMQLASNPIAARPCAAATWPTHSAGFPAASPRPGARAALYHPSCGPSIRGRVFQSHTEGACLVLSRGEALADFRVLLSLLRQSITVSYMHQQPQIRLLTRAPLPLVPLGPSSRSRGASLRGTWAYPGEATGGSPRPSSGCSSSPRSLSCGSLRWP